MSTSVPEELGNLKVVKSNDLVRSSYRLSKRGLVFIYYLIARLDSVSQDWFTDFILSYSQINKILNFDGKRRISKRSEVFALMDELNHTPIFREDAEDAIKVNWLSSVTHHKKTDVFRLRLDPLLKPHLLFLKSHFTEFFYKYILPMEPSSIGLYILLKSYHGGWTIEKIFEVEDLKFRLWIQKKYHKFYEFKRWVLSPALAELKRHTDIKATFETYEKVGKRINKIKFTVKSNKPTAPTPKVFLEKTPPVPVPDPLAQTEVYQALLSSGVSMNGTALKIAKKAVDDDAYREMILDTVIRCKNYLKSNPGIQNHGGFVLKAIQNDFYQQEREEETRKAEKIAQQKYQKDLEKEVAALLKEWKKKFEENRAPKLQELKAKYLNDELIEAAIKEYAPWELVFRKVLATVQAGKPSKMADRWINDYLADRYLDEDQKNLDTFLAKNYSLEKTDSGYQLSI